MVGLDISSDTSYIVRHEYDYYHSFFYYALGSVEIRSGVYDIFLELGKPINKLRLKLCQAQVQLKLS